MPSIDTSSGPKKDISIISNDSNFGRHNVATGSSISETVDLVFQFGMLVQVPDPAILEPLILASTEVQ